MQIIDKLKKQVEKENELSNKFICISDFIKKKLPENKWIINNLIPEGMTILSSAPGQFKTFLLCQLIHDLSIGGFALEYFQCEKRNILFINEEMGEKITQDRLNMIGDDYGKIWLSNLNGVKIDDADFLLEFCKKNKITLIVFDSLTRIHELKENSADEIKKLFQKLTPLLKNNISFIITHHNRKRSEFSNGSDEMRGSTDILAQLDCHLSIDFVDTDKTYLVLKQHKIRIAENIPDSKISIVKDPDKNRMNFTYSGIFDLQDEKEMKIKKYSDIVLKAIEENEGLTKEELAMKLKNIVSIRILSDVLPHLERSEEIRSEGKKKKYYIKNDLL